MILSRENTLLIDEYIRIFQDKHRIKLLMITWPALQTMLKRMIHTDKEESHYMVALKKIIINPTKGPDKEPGKNQTCVVQKTRAP